MWKIRRKRTHLQQKLDRILLRDFGAPYEITAPKVPTTPLILASPHSGRRYPQSFLAQTTLKLNELRLVEDAYVDEIFAPLSTRNIPFLRALFPRSYVDVNRSADEIPPYSRLQSQKNEYPQAANPRSISPRARIGLGVIPTRVNIEEDIYPQDLSDILIERRLEAFYHPYHKALRGLIDTAHTHFGRAVLLDCHSMPGHDPDGDKRPDFVLGDRYGTSCHEDTISQLESSLRGLGYSTVRNNPYAGGYTTKHYGRPVNGIEALQIEINKDLYLNSAAIKPHAGMNTLMRDMEETISQLAAHCTPNIGIAAQ